MDLNAEITYDWYNGLSQIILFVIFIGLFYDISSI
jgi:hypothetical protein